MPAGTPIDLEGEPIPATGPYMIDEVGEDGSLVLERNPMFREWSADAQPDGFADRIEVMTGVDPSEQVAMVEAGEADVALDGVPPISSRRSNGGLGSAGEVPWPAIGALVLDTASYPFENAEARRAVAYALQRDELARAFGETAAILAGDEPAEEVAVTCQILPPGMPGYAPYCPYTRSDEEAAGRWAGPDPSLARQLVRRSGTEGAEVGRDAALPRVDCRAVVDTLRGLGYRVVLETDGPLQELGRPCVFGALSPDADVSFHAWSNDYPSPAQYLVPLQSCVQPEGPGQPSMACPP